MKHLKLVLTWAVISAALLVTSLLLHNAPGPFKGVGILVMLVLVNGAFICRIVRAHK